MQMHDVASLGSRFGKALRGRTAQLAAPLPPITPLPCGALVWAESWSPVARACRRGAPAFLTACAHTGRVRPRGAPQDPSFLHGPTWCQVRAVRRQGRQLPAGSRPTGAPGLPLLPTQQPQSAGSSGTASRLCLHCCSHLLHHPFSSGRRPFQLAVQSPAPALYPIPVPLGFLLHVTGPGRGGTGGRHAPHVLLAGTSRQAALPGPGAAGQPPGSLRLTPPGCGAGAICTMRINSSF